MNTTIPLIVLAAVSVATGMWDLLKGNAKDVLRTAAFVELGLLLGTLLQIVFPAGFALGAIGGFAFAFTRFDEMNARRIEDLEARILTAPDEATSLLCLHDRIDALTAPDNLLRQGGVFLSLLFMMMLGVGVIGLGLASGIWPALLVGSGLLFLPVAQGSRMLVEFEERRALRERLRDTESATTDLLEPPQSAPE